LLAVVSSAALAFLAASRCAAATWPVLWCGGVLGQQSLLDLGNEEEPPPTKKAEAGAPVASPPVESPSTELPPATEPSLPPVVSGGTGELDDLLGEAGEKEEIPTEEVCDKIQQKRNGTVRSFNVKLLRDRLRPPLQRGGQVQVLVLTGGDRKPYPMTLPSEELSLVEFYEERMLKRVAEELREPRSEITRFDDLLDLSQPERLKRANRAITLLTTALAEHDSARERLLREGDEWHELRYQLAQALFRLQVSRVTLHFDQGQVQQATEACDRLLQRGDLGAGPRKRIREMLEAMLLGPALTALERRDYLAAGDALSAFADRFPSEPSQLATEIRRQLIAAAQATVQQAVAEKNPKLLETAATIWPHLSGLEDLRRRLHDEYPTLHCAYPTLPRGFSPLSAQTPVERHAAALLFEGLVCWREESAAGPHYASDLAESRPVPLARGREFRLPRAHWSDSDPSLPHYCTTEDVLWTVSLMKKVRPIGFPSAWGQLVKDVAAAGGDNPDPFRVSIHLEADHWQPLAFMDFPILPKAAFPTCGKDPAELARFERQPVGTGPFLLQDHGGDGKSVRFIANPFYRHADRPLIREIQFHQRESLEARDQFLKGDIDLVYDVRPAHVVELRRLGQTIVKLPARSIYFLAPNYRRDALQNADLRRAMASAIDREAILEANFRPGGARDHAPLNGPFPKSSWAYSRKVIDFAPAGTGAFLLRAKEALGGNLPKLTLIYPDRHPETQAACAEIQRQLSAAGIEIGLEAVEPHQFLQRVVEQHSFDLAYWRHDFKDETYWLWPLLDPADSQPHGANFMGYVPDKPLHDLFTRVMTHKMFQTIQQTTHEIHEYLAREAVVIPLWELDTYVAVGKSVQDARFSALKLFEDVDSWKVQAR